jgi:peptidoglycan/LPS O-acetylase OafA/YrhL
MDNSIEESQSDKPLAGAPEPLKVAARSKQAMAPTHLAFLDGLRGGAALWVLLAHCAIWGGIAQWVKGGPDGGNWVLLHQSLILGHWHGVPLPDAKIAVDVFMVLSGFLMAYLARVREPLEPIGTAVTAERFWIRRFFRIAPLYFFILAVTFTFGDSLKAGLSTLLAANHEGMTIGVNYLPENVHYTVINLLMHVSFLFGFFPSFAASTLLPDWSIGLEMQFYAAFPLLFLLFKRFKPVTAAILIFATGLCLRKLTHLLLGHDGFPENSFLPLKINVFLVGMLIASACRQFNNEPVHRALLVVVALLIASRESTCIVALAALIFLMTAEINGIEPLVARVKSFFARLLGNGVTRFMADTSYCVYLVHGFFIAFFGGWLYRQPDVMHWTPFERASLLTGITIVGAYTVGYICHKLVEQPGIRLGQKILTLRFPVRASIPAAAIGTKH